MKKKTAIRNVVIFGYSGQFGQLFARRMAESHLIVHGVDLVASDNAVARDNEASVIELVGSGDVILLCIPEQDVLSEIPFLSQYMKPGSLLVDIASVKANVTAKAESVLKNTDVEYLSIHPMFGPSVDFPGENMVFIECEKSDRRGDFIDLINSWGVTSYTLTATQHDEATKTTQVACHAALIAFASVAESSGLDFETIRKVETPVSRALFSISSRIMSGDPSLYYAIQHNDGVSARSALIEQLRSMNNQVATGDDEAWKKRFQQVVKFYGDDLELYTSLASEMLE